MRIETRFSLTVVGAVLLVAVTSPVLASGRDNRDDCGTSNPRKIADCNHIIPGSGEPPQNRDFAYHNPAHHLKRERDIAEYWEMTRLEPKDPHACDCGIKHQAGSEFDRAIVHYSEKLVRDSKDDNSFFRRGIAHLYAGSLAKALADLGQASNLDPAYPYYALWLDIVDKRSGLASRLPQAVPQINMTKWPAPVIRLLLGQMTLAAVLTGADDPDAVTKTGQICEANFYGGQLALQQGARDEATRLFRLAATDCPRDDFVEGPAAKAELTALGGTAR
jgi:lipoprotein NlpI